ncbi:hypothetical protein DTO164E3_854 [Paecilomyces variotii]|uniref:Putative RTA1 domain protein n=1 Tax=Byssochlamys spectabilis TaxID=264951 RepID=A0A443HQS3_BYSSP|nr:putative RTA1 domain protein [Paecilomyces variotii]KAJ9206613.1 hypothetical protein DTO164E3_854 [Paecilomyces variotii]KAJ9358227.1 hypothetical protein DTO280E4_5336 [Paecilomyces variotii]RWQ94130.1 putative RTA1 domain protein [Paecilomyces variotii]
MPSGHFGLCTEVTPQCPVQATTLGYYPNRGANVFFAVVFGICTLVTFLVGVNRKTWTFAFAVTAGFALETVGYIGRIILHNNPWSSTGFKIQIVCLILAPTLICAGIYLTLKHIALAISPHLSRLNPRLYTWLFIPFDIFCLVLQGVGGGVDASAETHPKLLPTGNNIIISGIVLQVVILSIFGLLSVDFFYRAKRYHGRDGDGDGDGDGEVVMGKKREQARVWRDRKFRIFVGAVSLAYLGILIRIAEMSGGWGNPVMQNEGLFIALEGVMVLYPAVLLSIFPPGIFFPQMSKLRSDYGKETALNEQSSSASLREGVSSGVEAGKAQ